jgi:hypothetical protein
MAGARLNTTAFRYYETTYPKNDTKICYGNYNLTNWLSIFLCFKKWCIYNLIRSIVQSISFTICHLQYRCCKKTISRIFFYLFRKIEQICHYIRQLKNEHDIRLWKLYKIKIDYLFKLMWNLIFLYSWVEFNIFG